MAIYAERIRRRLPFSVAMVLAIAAPFSLGQASAVAPQAQGAAPQLPEFEVATVKPTRPGNDMFFFGLMPDGIRIENIPIQEILRRAFGLEDDRILGSPAWVKAEHIDIDAKVDASDVSKLAVLTIEQRRAMLVPILVDRFGLKFHHEKRDLPIYNLVIAKGGFKLKESNSEFSQKHLYGIGRGQLESIGTPLASLVPRLSQELGRTVLDNTGLKGRYDYTLKWTPDDSPPPMSGGQEGGSPKGDGATTPDAGGPSLFTALQEQLGLKLESQKGPVDVIVIDHIEKPSPN